MILYIIHIFSGNLRVAFRGDSDGPNFPLFILIGVSVRDRRALPPRLGRLLKQEL